MQMVKQCMKRLLKKFNMTGQLSVWPVCLFSINKPEIGRVKNSFTSSKRRNEGRRMSEGAIVMPSRSAAAANFNNNNNGDGEGDRTTAQVLPRRKFSIPAALHAHGLYADLGGGGGYGNGGAGPSLAVATARRRFSNVSDAVSRKLSHTIIGWRTAVPTERIARQGKALCAQYVRWKLKRAGAYTKKCAAALRCVRSASAGRATSTSAAAEGFFIPPPVGGAAAEGLGGDRDLRREVFPAVLRVGLQLERLDPKLYAASTTAACCAAATRGASSADACASAADASAASTGRRRGPSASNQHHQHLHHQHQQLHQQDLLRRRRHAAGRRDSTTAAVVLVSVSRELFRAGAQVTWAKVVSLMCVSAGLAVDCARRGRGEQLADLVETFGEVVEDDLAAWIHYNGGWMGLQSYCKPVEVNVENPVSTHIRYLVSLLVVVILFLLFLRWSDFISVFR